MSYYEEIVEAEKRFTAYNVFLSYCTKCKHFNGIYYDCKAFPNGIPDKYLSGEKKHTCVDAGQEVDIFFKEID